MAGLVESVAASTYPVTVDEVKEQLRITDDFDDAKITLCRNASIEQIEAWQNRKLMNTTYIQYLDSWPSPEIILPRNPVSSITSIQYIDTAGDTQTWAASEYQTDFNSTKARVKPTVSASFPDLGTDYLNPVIITFVAGYGTATSDVPENTRQAVTVWAAHLFEQRDHVIIGQAINEVPEMMKSLITTNSLVEVI